MSEDRQKAASFPAVSGFGECDAGGARETSDRAPSRETLRILISNGIILYALTKSGGGSRA